MKAKERQLAGQIKGGEISKPGQSIPSPELGKLQKSHEGEARDIAAKKVGMGSKTLQKAKKIKEIAETKK